MSQKPETVGSSAGRKFDTGAAAVRVELAAEKRLDGVVAIAVGQLAGHLVRSEVRRESPEDAAVQVGAAMRYEQGVLVADGSLGFAAAETGVVMEIAAVAAVGNGCSE